MVCNEVMAHRREVVARLRLQGLTQREIAASLPEHGLINDETGKPWDLATVNRDLKAVEAKWMEQANASMAEHKSRLLAEYEEIRRQCAASGELKAWVSAMAQSTKLLGLAQERLDVTSGGRPLKAYVAFDPEGV